MPIDTRQIKRQEFRKEDFENMVDFLTKLTSQGRPALIWVEGESGKKEEKTLDANEQILRLDSEVQNLKDLFKKYLKVETKEESIHHFADLISKIDEVNEVHAHYIRDGVVFWIFYDKGDRISILEKIVDVECAFEGTFKGLTIDYRILPYSSMNARIALHGELVYRRGG